MKPSISIRRVLFLVGGALVFVAVLIFGGPITNGSQEALRLLVMTISILAGFLIAIITLSGDPQMLYLGSWRIASLHATEIGRALSRYRMLFYIYLLVIVITLLATLTDGHRINCTVVHWIDRCALGLGFTALYFSFGLPGSLIRIQKDRLEEEVKRRKGQS